MRFLIQAQHSKNWPVHEKTIALPVASCLKWTKESYFVCFASSNAPDCEIPHSGTTEFCWCGWICAGLCLRLRLRLCLHASLCLPRLSGFEHLQLQSDPSRTHRVQPLIPGPPWLWAAAVSRSSSPPLWSRTGQSSSCWWVCGTAGWTPEGCWSLGPSRSGSGLSWLSRASSPDSSCAPENCSETCCLNLRTTESRYRADLCVSAADPHRRTNQQSSFWSCSDRRRDSPWSLISRLCDPETGNWISPIHLWTNKDLTMPDSRSEIHKLFVSRTNFQLNQNLFRHLQHFSHYHSLFTIV